MPSRLSRLVQSVDDDPPQGSAELVSILYSELRKLASSLMARTPPGNTLQTTALVHEAYLRLIGDDDLGWNGRGHFFGAAAKAMRQILVDQARRKASIKRGGNRRRVRGEWELAIAPPPFDILALDEALSHLEQIDPGKVKIIQLRYFAGLTEEETAAALDIPLRTLQREWRFARALLFTQLSDSPSESL